jgi:hypothetical protein
VQLPTRACRAIGVTGTIAVAETDGGVVSIGAEAPAAWLDLPEGAHLQTKHPATGRELSFDGPGRVLPCVASRGRATDGTSGLRPAWSAPEEEAWIAWGVVASAPSGEAPGQEEWLVTPLGVVRYTAAQVKVYVDRAERRLRVSTMSGAAFAWTPDGITVATDPEVAAARDTDGWVRLSGAIGFVAVAKKPGSPLEDARAATTQCTAAAREAHDVAVALSRPDAAISQLGSRHVTARRIARAACAVASVRVSAVGGADAGAPLSAQIASAEAAWRNLGDAPK